MWASFKLETYSVITVFQRGKPCWQEKAVLLGREKKKKWEGRKGSLQIPNPFFHSHHQPHQYICLKLQLTIIYKAVNKNQNKFVCPLPHSKEQDTDMLCGQGMAWWAHSGFIHLSPCSNTTSFSATVPQAPGPFALAHLGTNELPPASNLPNLEAPPGLFLKTKPPGAVTFQTEVTVLTLAERACLNLLFRSCMLGDLGRGMRDVLRFSGVLLGCCLWLTSLHRTWKAL